MSIFDLLDIGGREIHHGSGFEQRHLGEVELIRKRLLMAQSQQKSYADRRQRPLEFEVGDHIFLKVMPKRGVVKFGKQGKLSSRFIGPFEVLKKVGAVSYWLALPPSLSCVHEVFHVSMLRKYTS